MLVILDYSHYQKSQKWLPWLYCLRPTWNKNQFGTIFTLNRTFAFLDGRHYKLCIIGSSLKVAFVVALSALPKHFESFCSCSRKPQNGFNCFGHTHPWGWAPPDVKNISPSNISTPWTYPPLEIPCQAYPPPGHTNPLWIYLTQKGPCARYRPPRGQRHTCENINFPQLPLRAVTMVGGEVSSLIKSYHCQTFITLFFCTLFLIFEIL